MSKLRDKTATGELRTVAGVRQDEGPHACAACGHPTMLFTPNARREPFATLPQYEAAWQCTKCGHLEFIKS
ncbi:MAG: hypothetical protein HYS05_07400 [Acidobacteria bacterium]|nr:hypothetical protein [Acidobacteriota bacterium]